MSLSTKKGDHSPLPGVEAWENEGGATAPRPAKQTAPSRKSSLSEEAEMNENLRIPAAIMASAMLVPGGARTHDELMKHYREFLKRLTEHEASEIHQSRHKGSSC
jgi:hypothetical protein